MNLRSRQTNCNYAFGQDVRQILGKWDINMELKYPSLWNEVKTKSLIKKGGWNWFFPGQKSTLPAVLTHGGVKTSIFWLISIT